MKHFAKLTGIVLLGLTACSTPKSYFTVGTRNTIENKNIPVEKLQFYIDKDVELKRELASKDAKVSSGKVIFENGKYVNIILLKAGTLGVCTQSAKNSLDISFESGDDRNISFAVPERAGSSVVYSLSPEKWLNTYNSGEIGKITYDGEVYFMRFTGARPKLMIKKTGSDKYEVNKRVMSGRKIDN
jgi:hypothetical protein